MTDADDTLADYWAWCAQNGVVSKKLFLRRSLHGLMPQFSLHVAESVRAGAVVATVPYLVTLNTQTIRGDMKPAAVPPVRAMCKFLTRRRRMDLVTARSLWLASCLACYRRLLAQGHSLSIAPLLSRLIMPELPSPFTSTHIRCYPAIVASLPEGVDVAALEESVFSSLWKRVEGQLRVTHAALYFYHQRRVTHIPRHLVPSFDELSMAYRMVLHRSLLLPIDCVPSSPGDLADLFTEQPDLDLLPTLVPVVDVIRSSAVARTLLEAKGGGVRGSQDDSTAANCALYTCTQSDFVSSGTRRRVVFETEPLSSRRVVVCATRDLKEGEELLLDYGSE
ncbi:hypothetical protein C3747_276g12 [Trypanosoma cruzi]|uniref:SET domain-containing protein n=2 Tax=Trypanosoma cruzi TaxID=5693 RepID=Q4DKQ7_TRYCC|nr:hypothetical protein, conserved [Trypanosoma cruzi]EAN93105.1 hypothetical protein, conserved [Trypanosoma cruzi]KAF5222014.1 hypothetical protein ECC02_004995 [Trypanosoma cruzi]PWU94577.1 hypothetical protein C3747_276g12 [Trypanosoma cruzi]|eukprot:XP_814956.1 hypothetical protein [Trypanosoma cruzi strain CL Brener]